MNGEDTFFIESKDVCVEQNRFRIGVLQKIRSAIERRKRLKTDETYDRDIYYEYQDGEEDEVLVRQDYILASDIDCGADAISEKDFPWHGHTYEEFIELNTNLQNLLPQILKIHSKEDVRRFRRKHPDIYEAYYQMPIHVLMKDGVYKFTRDGRHRIFVAEQEKSVIPFFVVEYAEIRKMTVEGCIERDSMRSWRF